jgi:hypothetical protein
MKRLTYVLILIFSMATIVASMSSALIVKADGNVVILSQTAFREYYYGGGIYHVFGETQNNGNQVLRYNITATFYDSKNDVVVTSFLSDSQWYNNVTGYGDSRAFSYLTVLQPGEKSPFELSLPNGWVDISQIDHYILEVNSSPATEFFLGLKIASQSLFNSSGDFRIDGELKNIGNKAMDEVKVLATFYNKTGEVVAAGSVGTGFSPDGNGEPGFSPNQTYQFSLTLASGILATVYPVIDHYELTAEGSTYADNATYSLGSTQVSPTNTAKTTGVPIELYVIIAIAILVVLIACLLLRVNRKRKRQLVNHSQKTTKSISRERA